MEINYHQPRPSRAPNLCTLLGVSCIIKVVDIGANPIDGPAPYASLLASGCAEVVGFEPNADALAKLARKKGPRETYLPYAIGDGRQHTLYRCQSDGMTLAIAAEPEVVVVDQRFLGLGPSRANRVG